MRASAWLTIGVVGTFSLPSWAQEDLSSKLSELSEQEKAALDAGAAFAGALDIVKAVIDSPVLRVLFLKLMLLSSYLIRISGGKRRN